MIQMMNGVVFVAMPFHRPKSPVEYCRVFAFGRYYLILEVYELKIFVGFHMPKSIKASLEDVNEE